MSPWLAALRGWSTSSEASSTRVGTRTVRRTRRWNSPSHTARWPSEKRSCARSMDSLRLFRRRRTSKASSSPSMSTSTSDAISVAMSAPGSNLPAESCGGSPRDRRRRQDRPATSKYTLGRNLLGAIFNQDWREDHDCVEEVYEDLLDGEPRHARLARAEQIEVFVADRSEDEVDDVFRASGKGLRPRSDLGVSSREWLLAVVH